MLHGLVLVREDGREGGGVTREQGAKKIKKGLESERRSIGRGRKQAR
jgi:hypothetical protein